MEGYEDAPGLQQACETTILWARKRPFRALSLTVRDHRERLSRAQEPQPMTRHKLVVLLAAVLAASYSPRPLITAAGGSAKSRLTRLDITSRQGAFGGMSFGAVGPYEILMGRATAVADPNAADGIVDVDKAPRNRDGLVEYSFDVHILKPVDVTKGNGVLVYEVNNRGNRLVYGYFNEGGPGYEAANVGNG